MRVLVFNWHFAPYRDRYYEYLQNEFGVQLTFYNYSRDTRLHDEWDYKLPGFNIKYVGREVFPESFPINYRIGMIKAIKEEDFDVCITPHWIVYYIVKLFKPNKKVIFTADTSISRSENSIYNYFKSSIYRRFDAIFCPGKASEKYFLECGVKKENIFQGYYTNDAIQIWKRIQSYNREEERSRIGINDEFVFLFVGKLIDNRRIENIIAVASKTVSQQIKYIVIGNGKNENVVKEYCREHTNIIHIPKVSLNELEKFYAIADGYVHPGHEPYSLALYEAAIAGLKIISTNNVGAALDCVENGKNGLIIEEDNIDSLYHAILDIATQKVINTDECKKMRDFILNFRGIKWAANNLYNAMK